MDLGKVIVHEMEIRGMGEDEERERPCDYHLAKDEKSCGCCCWWCNEDGMYKARETSFSGTMRC